MAPKPCHFFQLGACKNGNQCTYAHVIDPNFKRKPCVNYANGTCRRGKTCTFSHAKEDINRLNGALQADTNRTTAGPSNTATATETTEAEFRDWRYNIPLPGRIATARPLGTSTPQFYRRALEFVSGEAGLMQETILLLASEGGCLRITELIGQQFDRFNAAQFSRIFEAQLLPFFKTITHKNVTTSVILSSRLMTIYNIVYGDNGDRAVALYGAVAQHLQTLELTEQVEARPPNSHSVDAIETSLAALDKLIEVNTQAQVHDGLKLVAETLAVIFEDAIPESAVFAFSPAQKYLRRVQHRLGLGHALPNAAERTHVTGGRATFDLARERPGELSEEGPRHDNDRVDIRQISILPTLQEIQSSRTEYLPLADAKEWHLGGLEGLLDRHFRLLREDTVGQLRDAAKFELERLQESEMGLADNKQKRQGTRTFVYRNITISNIAFDPMSGMEFVLSFDQPNDLANKSKGQRRDWWEGSKRLGHEALICLLSAEGAVTFFIVSPAPFKTKKDGEIASLHAQYDLWSDEARAHTIAKPVVQADVHALLDRVLGTSSENLSLVEFPGVLLPAFKPTLQAMQTMSETLDVPFADILAPISTPANPNRQAVVAAPTYATRPGFSYDLAAVTGGTALRFRPGNDVDDMTAQLDQHSTLDRGQAQAVVHSLSRSLALIQGPPGTGKSYTGVQLIKILLDNKDAGHLGPIICVCFTNHALDQGLERLVDEGVQHVIRIGSSSKSERLAAVNLREVVKRIDMTKTEKSDRWQLRKKLEEETDEINRILGLLRQLHTDQALKVYLQQRYPDFYRQLFEQIDDQGFQRVDYHHGKILDGWLRAAAWGNGRPRTCGDLENVHVDNMSGQERRRLHATWLEDMRVDLQEKIRTAMASYNKCKERADAVRTEQDLRVLKQANIIGLTTSGLARNLDLLRRTGAKVLVCEEAGEVLEAHLLTALLPSVEHAILIGDHQQLRPHIQNYDLSSESKNGAQYSLDLSLFERLVQPQDILAQALPFSTLSVQRRMHPFISQLVRRTLYPQLQDAPSVNHPEVVGMRHRLFWMQHEHKENGSGDTSVVASHTNDYEVDMVAALVKHIVSQGVYAAEDLAVITPYLGQLRKIRKTLGATFNIVLNDRDVDELQRDGIDETDEEGAPAAALPRRASVARGTLLQALRLATVDNFQGEEAKIIVVSLVRSNAKKKPGFLRTSNRINVLLSRAQHGMYIIGDANTMQSVPMWADVLRIFKDDGTFGQTLELCCPRHKDSPLQINKPEDFLRIAPEAGCDLPCEKQLGCGHACVSKCHSEMLHNAVHCMKQCQRPKPGCTHTCPHPCGDPCDKQCLATVDGVDAELDCGHHTMSLPCYQHQDLSKVTCDVLVEKTVPGCEHHVVEQCHVEVTAGAYRCKATCGELLPCGHRCQRRCNKCRSKDSETDRNTIEHGKCTQPCDRNFTTCSHRCKEQCHGEEPCRLCNAKCDVRCAHSACHKTCHEPCAPCAEERCGSHCSHSTCSMPCAAPCDWLPCSLRCPKKLACGCQCPSLCGEVCPDAKFCQRCASEEIKEMQADMVIFETYRNIDLDEEPCIFTPCGHIFTLSTMDGIMDMPKHYKIDPTTDTISGLKTTSEPFSSDEMKSCPTCRSSLRSVSRYGRIVRRALLDESAKKLTAWSNRTHAELAERLANNQEELLASMGTTPVQAQNVVLHGRVGEQLAAVKKMTISMRYREILMSRNAIQMFADKLRKDEQPYQRVCDMVETARRQRTGGKIAAFDVSSSELQLREHVQAISLLMRCDLIVFSDVLSMHDQMSAGQRSSLTVDFGTNRARCDQLVLDAKDTQSVRQEVEGQLFWARYAAMQCGAFDTTLDTVPPQAVRRNEQTNKEALERLKVAEAVCAHFAGGDVDPTKGLMGEIADVRRMLNEGLSTSEMRMVVAAMAREFSGTGHWYRCANGHPFTVGECGMPMELARCPACGEGIGGQEHRPTEGVEAAGDIERQFGNLAM